MGLKMLQGGNLRLGLLFLLIASSTVVRADDLKCHECHTTACSDGPGDEKPCDGECGVITATKGDARVEVSRTCLKGEMKACAERLEVKADPNGCFKYTSVDLFKDDSKCKDEVSKVDLKKYVGTDATAEGHDISMCYCKENLCNGDPATKPGETKNGATNLISGDATSLIVLVAVSGLTLFWNKYQRTGLTLK